MVPVVFQMTGLELIFVIVNNVSINGCDSGLTKLNCGVPQGSVLCPLGVSVKFLMVGKSNSMVGYHLMA